MNKQELPDYRREAAIILLEKWAYSTISQRSVLELESGYCGESILCDFNHSKAYKPFCFKKKTNATQTRNSSKSKLPLGGGVLSERESIKIRSVNNILWKHFSESQVSMLLALFIPRTYWKMDDRLMKDYELAQLHGVPGKRASEWKIRAIKRVSLELFSPIVQKSSDSACA